jgi:hypothetical protein
LGSICFSNSVILPVILSRVFRCLRYSYRYIPVIVSDSVTLTPMVIDMLRSSRVIAQRNTKLFYEIGYDHLPYDGVGITPAECKSMFTLWTISCAPLYLGSDLTKMDAADLALISNRNIIAIDQPGVPAHPVDLPSLRHSTGQQLWAIRYSDGSIVLAIFNLADISATLTVPFDELDAVVDARLNGINPMDVVTSKLLPISNDAIVLQLESHASRLLRFAAK